MKQFDDFHRRPFGQSWGGESCRGLSTLHAFRKAEVAQISNLLCRRLPVGRCWNFEALADWKSAMQQTGSLRYGAQSAHDPFKEQSPLPLSLKPVKLAGTSNRTRSE